MNQRSKIQTTTKTATSVEVAIYLYWLMKLKELRTKLTRWVLGLFKFQYTNATPSKNCHMVPDVIFWQRAMIRESGHLNWSMMKVE
jgi:hypothetical protein